MNEPPAPVELDSRGILDPAKVLQHSRLQRYPVGPALEGLVDRFWTVTWDLPPGVLHVPQMVQHPCANLYVSHGQADEEGRRGPLEANLEGVWTEITSRRLAEAGWCVAAKATTGGLGAFITGPAADLTDREVPLGPALGIDGDALVADLAAMEKDGDRVVRLEAVLTEVVAAADPDRVAAARQVAAAARLVETDRSLRQVADLADAVGVSPRTLQRMFTEYAGVSPTWALRRYRLIDAAERVREGRAVIWSQVAADLGYSDQAHLVRDFRAVIGTTPAAYANAQLPLHP